MRVSVRSLINYLATCHECSEPIIDIGSYQVEGQSDFADLRPLFDSKEYIGCDIVAGPGVDRIEDAEQMTFESNSAGTILCIDTLEHMGNPLCGMAEIHRVVANEGLVVITSHMYAPVHYNPDYWRFTPQCFHDLLLNDFPAKAVLFIGEETFPELVAGIAAKTDELPVEIDLAELNSMLPWPYPYPFKVWGRHEPDSIVQTEEV